MSFITRQLRTLLLAAVLVMGWVCVSYGQTRPAALVGKWVIADGYTGVRQLTLLADGSGILDGAVINWKVENNRLILPVGPIRLTADYKVSGYELVLVFDSGGGKATFVKDGMLMEYLKKKEKETEQIKMEAERTKNEAGQRFEKVSGYFTDPRDGRKYRTVKIGGKSWMAENMNYAGVYYQCYDGNKANCEKYGRLYDWNTAKTVCPSGWSLPGESWVDLAELVGEAGTSNILKSVTGWVKNGNGTDDFGFSALPGGIGSQGGKYAFAGENGVWWADEDAGNGKAAAFLFTHNGGMDGQPFDKRALLSVRCVAD